MLPLKITFYFFQKNPSWKIETYKKLKAREPIMSVSSLAIKLFVKSDVFVSNVCLNIQCIFPLLKAFSTTAHVQANTVTRHLKLDKLYTTLSYTCFPNIHSALSLVPVQATWHTSQTSDDLSDVSNDTVLPKTIAWRQEQNVRARDLLRNERLVTWLEYRVSGL